MSEVKIIRKKDGIDTRHVYYSVTTDNPFLPKWYIEQLKQTFTKQECERMLYGRWIEIKTETIYYGFNERLSTIDYYKVNPNFPIIMTWDFNIGKGKPMSMAFRQRIKKVFYYFAEIVIHGTRTEDILEEAHGRGLLFHNTIYIVRGDASGSQNSTATKKTDYGIIDKYLSNCTNKHGGTGISHKMDAPFSNPPVRTRHILVNGQLAPAEGGTNVKILAKDCPILVKGLKLTRLKDGGQYIENDNDEWQHITTAMGYDIVQEIKKELVGIRLTQRKGL